MAKKFVSLDVPRLCLTNGSLALSRRIGEAIRIGDDFIFEVIDLERHMVMLELERPDPDFDRSQWLVVHRQAGEEFQGAEDIRVQVNRINGGIVRLGIDAPRIVEIVRAELEQHPDELQPAKASP